MPRIVTVKTPTTNRQPIRAIYCASFFCRLKGLMFHRPLSPDEGLLLVQPKDSRLDSSIHMLFVWFDLGIVWINDEMTIVDMCIAKAWRPAYLPKAPARYVLEIRPENLEKFHIGQKVTFEDA